MGPSHRPRLFDTYVIPGPRRRGQRQRIFWRKIGPWAVGRIDKQTMARRGGVNAPPPGLTSYGANARKPQEWWDQF